MDSRKPTFMSRSSPLSRFTASRLRRLFLGECRWGTRYFWNRQAYVGYGHVPGSHNKKGHVPFLYVRRAPEKYRIHTFSQGYLSEIEPDSATGVLGSILVQFCHWDSPDIYR